MKNETKQRLKKALINTKFFRFLIVLLVHGFIVFTPAPIDMVADRVTWILISSFILIYSIDKWEETLQ